MQRKMETILHVDLFDRVLKVYDTWPELENVCEDYSIEIQEDGISRTEYTICYINPVRNISRPCGIYLNIIYFLRGLSFTGKQIYYNSTGGTR